jgi:hypothetical protein
MPLSLRRPLFIGTVHESKHLPLASIEMAPANDAERSAERAAVHQFEMTPMQQAEYESNQAMTSLYLASQYMEHHETINDYMST